MSAFLKIDRCTRCSQDFSWEWVPAVLLTGKTLAGTGVWRSTLTDGLCPTCSEELAQVGRRQCHARSLREHFIDVVGGIVPYRDFTLGRYDREAGNHAALEQARAFNPDAMNLYFWGAPGVGKTHLAVAILRLWFGRGASGVMTTPFQLVRRLRMRAPVEEQRAIEELVDARILILDDLGSGTDSLFAQQVLLEILDGRKFRNRAGLIVTSPYSTDELARRTGGGAIASRLAGMCRVVEVRGPDHRRQGVSHRHGGAPS